LVEDDIFEDRDRLEVRALDRGQIELACFYYAVGVGPLAIAARASIVDADRLAEAAVES